VHLRRREVCVSGSASLLPEGGRVRSGMAAGARVILSLLVLIFMLTCPEPSESWLALVVP